MKDLALEELSKMLAVIRHPHTCGELASPAARLSAAGSAKALMVGPEWSRSESPTYSIKEGYDERTSGGGRTAATDVC